jgi:hypothetical protein
MKMLVVQGYFEEGKFVTDTSVIIPEKKKTIVTVLDEEALSSEAKKNKRIEKWEEFRLAIESDKEGLPDDFPLRMGNFRTPEELNLRD